MTGELLTLRECDVRFTGLQHLSFRSASISIAGGVVLLKRIGRPPQGPEIAVRLPAALPAVTAGTGRVAFTGAALGTVAERIGYAAADLGPGTHRIGSLDLAWRADADGWHVRAEAWFGELAQPRPKTMSPPSIVIEAILTADELGAIMVAIDAGGRPSISPSS